MKLKDVSEHEAIAVALQNKELAGAVIRLYPHLLDKMLGKCGQDETILCSLATAFPEEIGKIAAKFPLKSRKLVKIIQAMPEQAETILASRKQEIQTWIPKYDPWLCAAYMIMTGGNFLGALFEKPSLNAIIRFLITQLISTAFFIPAYQWLGPLKFKKHPELMWFAKQLPEYIPVIATLATNWAVWLMRKYPDKAREIARKVQNKVELVASAFPEYFKLDEETLPRPAVPTNTNGENHDNLPRAAS